MEFEVKGRDLYATGEIRDGDYEKLLAFFRGQPPKVFVDTGFFDLNSPGGSVTEALKLAQFISGTFRMTRVGPQEKCMSSCFFLFVSGGFRFQQDGGVVGIHRPYMERAKFAALSQTDAVRVYDMIDTSTRRFLASMRVPDVLVNKMFATSSEDIYILSDDELDHQIGFWQPWWQEMASSACSKDLSKRLECMHERNSLDRLDEITKFLGTNYSDTYRQEITNLTIQVMSKVFKTSKGPLPAKSAN